MLHGTKILPRNYFVETGKSAEMMLSASSPETFCTLQLLWITLNDGTSPKYLYMSRTLCQQANKRCTMCCLYSGYVQVISPDFNLVQIQVIPAQINNGHCICEGASSAVSVVGCNIMIRKLSTCSDVQCNSDLLTLDSLPQGDLHTM
jgi:hypothetical protein